MTPERISVKRGCKHGVWFVCVGDETQYLHSDGVVREGTLYCGNWSGYYRSRKAAQAAIGAYQKRQAEAAK